MNTLSFVITVFAALLVLYLLGRTEKLGFYPLLVKIFTVTASFAVCTAYSFVATGQSEYSAYLVEMRSQMLLCLGILHGILLVYTALEAAVRRRKK